MLSPKTSLEGWKVISKIYCQSAPPKKKNTAHTFSVLLVLKIPYISFISGSKVSAKFRAPNKYLEQHSSLSRLWLAYHEEQTLPLPFPSTASSSPLAPKKGETTKENVSHQGFHVPIRV
jgi:hypothetical protein